VYVQLCRARGRKISPASRAETKETNKIENKRKTDFLFELMLTYNETSHDISSLALAPFGSSFIVCCHGFSCSTAFFVGFESLVLRNLVTSRTITRDAQFKYCSNSPEDDVSRKGEKDCGQRLPEESLLDSR
jgi:hypothetical protein